MEYLNEDNILVTVLAAKMKDYDTIIADVHPDAHRIYNYYFLNPNKRNCVSRVTRVRELLKKLSAGFARPRLPACRRSAERRKDVSVKLLKKKNPAGSNRPVSTRSRLDPPFQGYRSGSVICHRFHSARFSRGFSFFSVRHVACFSFSVNDALRITGATHTQ